MGRGLLPTEFADSEAEIPSASKFNNNFNHVNMTQVNMVINGHFARWTAGTSVAPDSWTLVGTGASVARSATAYRQAYSAQVGYGSADSYIKQAAAQYTHMKGKQVRAWAWVKASVPNQARIKVVDGVGTYTSSYHTGGGGWELLSVVATISASATKIELELHCESSGSIYFDSAVMADYYDVMGWFPSISETPVVPGSNKQVFFNDNGAMGAASGFEFDKATGLLSATVFSGALGKIGTIGAGVTTPSATGVSVLKYATAANISVTNFTNGFSGQILIVTNMGGSGITLTITNDHVYTPTGGSITLNNKGAAGLLCIDGSVWTTLFVQATNA